LEETIGAETFSFCPLDLLVAFLIIGHPFQAPCPGIC
jgi:hypothetical protein